MRIELTCRCGATGVWDARFEEMPVKLAGEWLAAHKDCVPSAAKKVEGVSPAGIRKWANAPWDDKSGY